MIRDIMRYPCISVYTRVCGLKTKSMKKAALSYVCYCITIWKCKKKNTGWRSILAAWYQWYSATTARLSMEKYKRMSLSTHVQCSLRGQEKYTRSLWCVFLVSRKLQDTSFLEDLPRHLTSRLGVDPAAVDAVASGLGLRLRSPTTPPTTQPGSMIRSVTVLRDGLSVGQTPSTLKVHCWFVPSLDGQHKSTARRLLVAGADTKLTPLKRAAAPSIWSKRRYMSITSHPNGLGWL